MPPTKKAPLTEEEILKAQAQAEQEVSHLKREYIALEKDRKQYYHGIGSVKLPKFFAINKKQHIDILADLRVANSSAKKREDAKNSEKLTFLLTDYDMCSYKVFKEKQYMKETEEQIKILKKEVIQLRCQEKTDKQHEERVVVAIKTIETLENKLEVEVKKFGKTYSELCGFRTQIKDMLRVRETFIKIWDKMIQKLISGKRFMLDLIEQATYAYDQREEWCSKLQNLRLRARNDLMLDSQQMNILKRRQDQDGKLKEFFYVKTQRRVMFDLQKKEAVRRMETKQRLTEQKQQYKQLMDEILEFTDGSPMKTVAKKFCNLEEENFSYFNKINDLMEEMEQMNDQLGKHHLEIEEQTAMKNVRIEKQNNILDWLERQLHKVQNEFEVSKKEVENNLEYLNKILEGINTLFNLCRCNNDSFLQLLDNSDHVNFDNVFLYLELIEKKIHHALLEAYYRNNLLYERKKITYHQRIVKESRTKPIIYTWDQIVSATPCPLCYLITSDHIDTLQTVLARSEVKEKVKVALRSGIQAARVHNVSDCQLPRSRAILQRRYL